MSIRILIPIEDLLFESTIIDFLIQLNTIAVKLKVLHVIDSKQAVFSSTTEEHESEPFELVRQFADQLKDHFPGVEVVTTVCEGDAKEEIVREAEQFKADLILMGPHGKRGIGKLLLGSTSQGVISAAPCSVVLLRSRKAPHTEECGRAAPESAKRSVSL